MIHARSYGKYSFKEGGGRISSMRKAHGSDKLCIITIYSVCSAWCVIPNKLLECVYQHEGSGEATESVHQVDDLLRDNPDQPRAEGVNHQEAGSESVQH